MDGPLLLLVVHVAATLFMVGLIWTIQVVHYPLFAAVDAGSFAAYERAHQKRIGSLLILPWGLEVLTALLIAILTPDGVSAALSWLGLGVAIALGALTVVVFAPIHRELSRGTDPAAIARLANRNWLRTVLWTGHGAIAMTLLVQHLDR